MTFVRVLCVTVLLMVIGSAAIAQVDYSTKIQPIFNANCIGCHGSVRSGVTLTGYAAVMASVGTQYGTKIVVPGNGAASPLYDKVAHAVPLKGTRMPRSSTPLTDEEILAIKNWIDQGAAANAATGIVQQASATPSNFSLSQNYPNPFNPVTHVAFSIPAAQYVTMTIFDLTGRETALLVNRTLEAGSYVIEWNAAGAPSGMYFCQLRASSPSAGQGQAFVSTKKLILQK